MVFKFLSPIQKPPKNVSPVKYKVVGIIFIVIMACAAAVAIFGIKIPVIPSLANNTSSQNSNTAAAANFNVTNVVSNSAANAAAANSNSAVSISSFTAMTANAACADVRNDLYLIDGKLVFWVRTGKCPDAAYAYILYGQTPQEKLCSYADSIAGPRESCLVASYQELFSSMIHAVDDQQLGLDSSHTVAKVSQ